MDDNKIVVGMNAVRRALWEAYEELKNSPDGICGKCSEGFCEVTYPNYWDCKSVEEFMQPNGLMVYSYALGPSRRHYFNYAEKYREVNYYTWESPNPAETAVMVINKWRSEIGNE